MNRLVNVTTDLFKNEGVSAFYKGITPRVLRVAPGQAIVFTVSQALATVKQRPRENGGSWADYESFIGVRASEEDH